MKPRIFLFVLHAVLRRFVLLPFAVTLFMILHCLRAQEAANRVLRWSIHGIGGFFIKTIQFLASHECIPKEYSETLAGFLDEAPFMNTAIVHDIMLTKPPAIYLQSLSDMPIGSGSIAQVHVGWWNDRMVACKIQKPDAWVLFQLDLFFLRVLFAMITWWLGEIPCTPFFLEFVDRVQSEFDFENEARAMVHARQLLCDDKDDGIMNHDVIVPEVHAFTKTMIVMEYVEHMRLDSDIVRSLPDVDKLCLSVGLCDAVARMLIVHGLVHIDPHIGNVCLTADMKSIVLFDWGQSKILSEHTIEGLAKMILYGSTDVGMLRQGMDICGIDPVAVPPENIMLIMKFFNHKHEKSAPYFWNMTRHLIRHTTQQSRHRRNPFHKQSRELILILKTHDLLDTVMDHMIISDDGDNLKTRIFPLSMIKASEKRLLPASSPSVTRVVSE